MNYELPSTSRKQRNSLAMCRDSSVATEKQAPLNLTNQKISQVIETSKYEARESHPCDDESEKFDCETPAREINEIDDPRTVTTIRTRLFETPGSISEGPRHSTTPSRSSAFNSAFHDFTNREEEDGQMWLESFKNEMSAIDKRRLH